MSIIYNGTIESTVKENHYHITWHNPEKNSTDSFTQSAGIMPDEVQRLWHQPLYQLTIGQKLFRFLDGEAHHFQQALDHAWQQGESLQIYLHACKETADWPFELLARDNEFLLPNRRLHLVRCVSDWGKVKNIPPKNRPLKFLFMACSAIDVQPELDFEREGETIFHITEKLPIDMEVEDSGSLEGLRRRLEQEHFDVVHLSGHADIDESGSPFFVMEDETGHEQKVFPGELWNEALIENPPRLLFLSGCRTGERVGASGASDTTGSVSAVSFARVLVVNYHVPAVLGWGRSVVEEQANHATRILFRDLSRGKSILESIQRARYELLKGFLLDPILLGRFCVYSAMAHPWMLL
jgi:hypothetical protein